MLDDNVLTVQNSDGDYSFPVLSFVGAMILYALALIAFLHVLYQAYPLQSINAD